MLCQVNVKRMKCYQTFLKVLERKDVRFFSCKQLNWWNRTSELFGKRLNSAVQPRFFVWLIASHSFLFPAVKGNTSNRGNYCSQLNVHFLVTESFFIIYSTCFGPHWAHHQEYTVGFMQPHVFGLLCLLCLTSGVPKGGFGGFKPPPRIYEVLPKPSRIPSSVEYTSITT
jgi:hypothetical protein